MLLSTAFYFLGPRLLGVNPALVSILLFGAGLYNVFMRVKEARAKDPADKTLGFSFRKAFLLLLLLVGGAFAVCLVAYLVT